MRRLRLWKVAVRFGFRCMDQVRKFYGSLDEEHGNVVADEIPVAFFSVDFHSEATHVGARSGEPLLPATVENRTKAGVFSPTR